MISPNREFGVELLKWTEIPSPTGRGRTALVPQLTIAKILDESLRTIAKNGVGVSEEACGFNLEAPATQKEAAKLGIKKLTSSFFAYVKKELENYKLADSVNIVRREGGKKLYIVGPQPEN